MSEKQIIAAIDPGKDKCGVAILTGAGEVLLQKIVPTDNLPRDVKNFAKTYGANRIVIGNGTTSRDAQKKIAALLPDLPLSVVDEYKTTLAARTDYFAANPPKGWRRLLPLSLQTPPVPIDDFVAVRIGRKFLGILEE